MAPPKHGDDDDDFDFDLDDDDLLPDSSAYVTPTPPIYILRVIPYHSLPSYYTFTMHMCVQHAIACVIWHAYV